MPRAEDIVGGKYVLSEVLGEGAMGSVWRAVHQGLGRSFAVKFLKRLPGPDAAIIEQRFVREALLVASVQHRYVVSVVDAGVTEDGTPYMVMEHLRGETLGERRVRQPALSARELCTYVAQALEGLEAVHAAGIVHRDVKPDNIVLADDGGVVVPKLVDFGVSCALHEAAQLGRLTTPGTAVGTPWYMAPEQVRGLQDQRSDLYSMGVVLYEALVGRAPYTQPDLLLLLQDVVNGAAPPAVTLRPALGAELSAFIARAMAAQPDARFASAAEMAAALRVVAARLPAGLECPRHEDAADVDAHLYTRVTEVRTPTHRSWWHARLGPMRAVGRVAAGGVAAAIAATLGLFALGGWGRSDAASSAPVSAAVAAMPAAPVADVVPRAPEPVSAVTPPPATKARPVARPQPPRRKAAPPEAFRDPGF